MTDPARLAQRIYEAACSAPGASYEIMTQPSWDDLDPAHRACWHAAAVEARRAIVPGLPELFPVIVCLCGSTRFVDEFNRQRKALTERGQIVLGIEVVTTQAREHDPQHVDPALKARLDELHKRKIDLADYVLVLNVGGYAGESTRSEIRYARAHGKPVRYLQPQEPGPYCGCGYDDCSACAGHEWACLHCGDAFVGGQPDDGLCPGCRQAVRP